jgi:crotonobetainyl-CoA:carnitine CoA-transferase CaiB-like acyl-CoA transferase
VNDPEVGDYCFARTVPHLSSTPELPAEPAPALGQHTRYVLSDLLGYSTADVDRLAREGVVQTTDANPNQS